MSTATEISIREAYPVKIGTLTLYCEHFKAVGTRAFAEKSTVSGETFYSNANKKSLRVTFEGRIYNEASPLEFVTFCDDFISTNTGFDVEYRGITFKECHVQSYTAEDKGQDYIYGTVTLVTVNPSEGSEA
jgi:hypothetical protein